MDWSSVESNTETIESTEYQEEESVPEEQEQEQEVDPRELLTKEQIRYFKELFESLDQQKQELVPAKSVGFVLRLMGHNPTKAEIKKHIREIDPLNKGLVDFRSFLLPIAQRINQETDTHEDIIAAFEALDEDDEGFLTTDQLYEFLTTLGEVLDDFEVELFLKVAESKGTKKVHYRDFVHKMMGISRKIPKNAKKKQKKKKKKK